MNNQKALDEYFEQLVKDLKVFRETYPEEDDFWYHRPKYEGDDVGKEED